MKKEIIISTFLEMTCSANRVFCQEKNPDVLSEVAIIRKITNYNKNKLD